LRLELEKKVGFYKEPKKALRETTGMRTEEDNFIQQAKDAGQSRVDINWEALAKKHPNLDIDYIKSKL